MKRPIIFRILLLFGLILTTCVSAQTTVTLNPVQDTYLSNASGGSAKNYGTCTDLFLRYPFDTPLFDFDYSSIPVGATITSAIFRLNKTHHHDPTVNYTTEIHRVSIPWNEGTECDTNGIPNWTSPWTNSGGDFEAPVEATTTVTSTNGIYTWNVTGMVSQFHSGAVSNYGFGILPVGPIDQNATIWDSREGTVPPELVITYTTLSLNTSVTDESCAGALDGAVDLTVSGNVGTTSYSWTGPNGFTASTEDISGLEAGTYSVTVTDDNGSETISAVVNVATPPLVLSTTVTQLSAAGASDGAIDLTVTGGAPNYGFNWTKDGSPYATTEDISGLDTGVYAVTVTDSCGQIETTSVTIQYIEIVQKQLYLSEPGQGLDRIDPTTTSDPTVNSPELMFNLTGSINVNPTLDGIISDFGNGGQNEADETFYTCSTLFTSVDERPYFRFDISSLPPNAIIDAATMYVYQSFYNGNGSQNFEAHQLNSLSTATLGCGVTGTPSWNSESGGDFNATVLDTEATSDAKTGTFLNWDITAAAQNWHSTPSVYPGILLTNDGSKNNYAQLSSVERADVTKRPYIEVSYHLPPNSSETFTQGTPMCSDLAFQAAEQVIVTAYATVTTGTMPANPDVDAVLEYGSTTILDLSGITPTWDGSKFTWTATMPGTIVVPTGESISLSIITNESNLSFTIDYDSQTKPSKIQIPTNTYINVDSNAFYDAPYPGGNLITQDIPGQTVYFRTTASDPFGAYDITALNYEITDPDSGVTNVSATEVASAGCTKTFEYAWTIPTTAGLYSIEATADEGTEGVQATATTSFTAIIPYSLTKTISNPANGPYTLGDNITYTLTVENTGPNEITTLPLQDIFDSSCFQFVSASQPPDNNVNGVLTWNNLGPLAGSSSLTVDVTLQVSGNCDPANNLAKVEGATDNLGNVLETKSDSVDITIDEAPITTDDNFCVSGIQDLDVLANDTDADNDLTTLTIISGPTAGAASVTGSNLIQFDPSGMTEDQSATFTYQICDNAGSTPFCSTAVVTVIHSSVNNVPTVVADATTTTLNLPVTISVLDNDSDTEGDLDVSSLSITSSPTFGTAVVNPDGTITYSPNIGYEGTDQLTYEICDSGCPGSQCASATVAITVEFATYACQVPGVDISVPPVPGADGYVWSLPSGAVITNGDGTNSVEVDFSSVTPGNYSVCVEPTNDCGPGSQQCVQLVVNEVILTADTTDVLCNSESSGAIDLNVSGGVPPYTYSWSNGATVEDLSALPAGTYDVTVTDYFGCQATLSTSLGEPATLISLTGTVTDEDPYGSSNGAIDITPSGGTPGYTYVWSNGATSEDLSGLAGGSYTVTITDSNGCSTDMTFTVNTVGGPLQITLIAATDVLCFGDSTGAVDLEVIGGSGTYTYSWSNGATTQDLANVPAGSYTVTISDGVNPDIVGNVTVSEPLSALSVTLTATNIQCNGTATGAIDATASGGTAPYTFSWTNGATTEDISGLTDGTYSLTVTDANGCTASDTMILSEPAALTATATLNEVSCGSGSDGSIDISPTGGTLPYTFSWTNGAISEDISGVPAGTYSVTITDALGCDLVQTYTLETACLGIAKALIGSPINNNDGSYNIAYDVLIANTGNVDLVGVDPVDNLQTTFAAASGYAVNGISIIGQPTSGGWTANAIYDGNAVTQLLDAPSTLVAGESGTIRIEITVTPGTTLSYDNTATVLGSTNVGVSLTDDSQDGNLVDPDNDGNPTNNTVPTPLTFTENPEIGLAKSVIGSPINNGDGTHSLIYEIRLENTGDVPLQNVQVTDDLSASFPGLILSGISTTVITQPSGSTINMNGSFNGSGDIELLAGTDMLPADAFALVQINLTVALDGSLGPFLNSATASGTSLAGTSVNDTSHNGSDVDPESDGPSDNSDPTPITFIENPEIGVAKTVINNPLNNGDGSHTLTYRLRIENTGDTPLNTLQLTDDLSATFSGLTVTGVSTNIAAQPVSTTLALDGAYDGQVITTLLDETSSSLLPGEYALIDIQLTVQPSGSLGPFDNSALGGGTASGGVVVTDTSQNGAQVDPEGNGPGDNSDPTPVSFTENPMIGAAKTVSAAPTNNNDGSYTLSYQILIENLGDIELQNIQITEDLSTTFSGAGVSVNGTTSGTFTINPSFDGSGDTNLLLGTDSLAAGASGTVILTVTVIPGTNLGPYNNTVTANATTTGGTVVSDLSWNGSVVDPDGDGDPTNNASVTPISFVENPIIGAAKTILSGPTETGTGTGIFDLTYNIRIENIGDVPVNDIQLYESLAATFANASSFTVGAYNIIQQPSSTTLSTNPSYDGDTQSGLLVAGSILETGEFAILQLNVQVTPGGVGGPYDNSAIVTGTSTGGTALIDYSEDGTNVDPNGDGITSDNNTPTTVIFFENPLIGIAKDVANVVDNGDGTNTVTLTIILENFGDVPLYDTEVFDDIVTQFSVVSPTNFSVSSSDLLANTSWNGTGGSNLLEPGQTMEIGQVAALTIIFDVIPNVASLDNTATAVGTGPLGGTATDDSTTGLDPDGTDGDNNPDENIPTTVTFAPVFDYSDAPDSYGSPRHLVVSSFYIGSEDPDTELTPLNSANGGTDATGDNTIGIDDETSSIPQLVLGRNAVMTVTVSGSGGYLQGWIDFDLNGVFDSSEQVATDVQDGGVGDLDGTTNGSILMTIAVPPNATTNPTYARFRWSTQSGLDALGEASNGEVEDYGGIQIRQATIITNRRITYRVKKN